MERLLNIQSPDPGTPGGSHLSSEQSTTEPLEEETQHIVVANIMYCHEVTWIWNEVRIVAPGVLQPILLEQSALLLRGPDKLGLVTAALGAPGPENETNQDNHQDKDRDDGQEDPDNWSHLDSLMR